MKIFKHICLVTGSLLLTLGIPFSTSNTCKELLNGTDAVSSASVIIDQPSGNYVILLNLDSMEEDDFWMDFFSGESVDFCFEDISCMTAKNDPTAITMAQSFQSRLSEHQMTLRTEDATLMLSRADEGKFQVIVLSEEIAEHYHAQSVMMGKTAQNTVWIPLTNLDGIEEDET